MPKLRHLIKRYRDKDAQYAAHKKEEDQLHKKIDSCQTEMSELKVNIVNAVHGRQPRSPDTVEELFGIIMQVAIVMEDEDENNRGNK